MGGLFGITNSNQLIKSIFLIPNSIGVSSVETNIKIHVFSWTNVCSIICFCYYLYAIVIETLDCERSDLFQNTLNNVIDYILLLISLMALVLCNFNRYYYAQTMSVFLKKLAAIESDLNNLKLMLNYKK